MCLFTYVGRFWHTGTPSAKVVIGDLDVSAAEDVINEIVRAGGWTISLFVRSSLADIDPFGSRQGIFKLCDVTSWDDQVSLFEFAMSTYGSVDIVVCLIQILDQSYQFWAQSNKHQVPNAGVGERGSFSSTKLVDGKPIKPLFKTLDINLIGAMYSKHLRVSFKSLDNSLFFV